MGALTSVYVHFPWCIRKCPYCDFATRAMEPEQLPHEAYADALLRELRWRGEELGGRTLRSVFFGGGTPSLWEPGELGRVLGAIRSAFGSEVQGPEITVECNPSSLDGEHARKLRDVGVNRLSVGVQSFNDEHLRYLGRWHDAGGARRSLGEVMRVMPRVSGDLMFGMPGQDAEQLRGEIGELLSLGVGHVSAYALTIEPGTRFGELRRKGELAVADEDDYARMFEEATRLFEEQGFDQYEVSNYAQPGQEARHNQHYWEAGDYVGLGAAAVGCMQHGTGHARRWKNHADPRRYMKSESARQAEREVEELGPQDMVREALMLGLRTREGVDLQDTRRRAGVDPLAGRQDALGRRQQQGDVVLEGDRLRVPREHWFRLDGIVADLF
jgi:oxygen-independent coproporphyrinogen-3 oxidase